MLENFKETFLECCGMLSQNIRDDIKNAVCGNVPVFEIRLISDCRPLIIAESGIMRGRHTVTLKDLEESVLSLTGNSYHSYQREIARGYIPLKNGHRAGLAGTFIYDDKGNITGLKNVTSIILRIANEINFKYNPLFSEFSKKGVYSYLVSGAPCSGKTSLLRDTAKKLSETGYNTVLVDEKQELFKGLRECTVIKGAEKAEGIRMAVKNLSPQVIVCDEISAPEEAEALLGALNSGVSVLASIHARDMNDFKNKKTAQILTGSKEFRKVIFLDTFPNIGRIKETADLV